MATARRATWRLVRGGTRACACACACPRRHLARRAQSCPAQPTRPRLGHVPFQAPRRLPARCGTRHQRCAGLRGRGPHLPAERSLATTFRRLPGAQPTGLPPAGRPSFLLFKPGGPVYISDKPGHHDFALLRRLVLADGSGGRVGCLAGWAQCAAGRRVHAFEPPAPACNPVCACALLPQAPNGRPALLHPCPVDRQCCAACCPRAPPPTACSQT